MLTPKNTVTHQCVNIFKTLIEALALKFPDIVFHTNIYPRLWHWIGEH